MDGLRPTIEMVSDEEYSAMATLQLLPTASAHDHAAADTDLGHLLVDDDVGADISMLQASTTSPPVGSGERVFSSSQPLVPLLVLRHKRYYCFSSTGSSWERGRVHGSCLEPSGSI